MTHIQVIAFPALHLSGVSFQRAPKRRQTRTRLLISMSFSMLTNPQLIAVKVRQRLLTVPQYTDCYVVSFPVFAVDNSISDQYSFWKTFLLALPLFAFLLRLFLPLLIKLFNQQTLLIDSSFLLYRPFTRKQPRKSKGLRTIAKRITTSITNCLRTYLSKKTRLATCKGK